METKNVSNKVIHYCWFGGNPLSELTKKCIASWKKYLPDFEIKEWNEKNFDVNQCEFVKQAYEQKKWAFVADYTRFKVLEQYGGLYLDTDMEITADIAKYLEHDLFLGCEDSKLINAAVVWSKEKNNKHIKNIVKTYEDKEDFNVSGDLYKESVPQVLSTYFKSYGFDKEKEEIQVLDENSVYIYPMEYFYPLSYDHQHNKFTENSCMIHHFDATWISPMEKFKTDMKRKNMKWVVYVIDFFINTKNFIFAYLNYKDIVIFIMMFLIMALMTFAFKPLDEKTILFGNNSCKYSTIILVEGVLAYIWTDICKRLRLFEINKALDKNLLENKSCDYRKSHINNEKLKSIELYENKIWGIQVVCLIIFSILCPIFYSINGINTSQIIFSFCFIEAVFTFYIGIMKEFKYRILDLLLIDFMLSIMSITSSYGLIIGSLMFFVFALFIFKAKLSKKRNIAFIGAAAFFIVIAQIVNFLFGMFDINFNVMLNFENLNKFSTVTSIENYDVNSNVITNFQASNNMLVSIIKTFLSNPCLHILSSAIGIFILDAIVLILIALTSKNFKYLFLLILPILNTIFNINYDCLIYSNYLVLIFLVIVLVIFVFNKIFKDEKIIID